MSLQYICAHCDNLECETSICPVCGTRTVLKKHEVFWSDEKNTPVLTSDEALRIKARRIAPDLRPVFPQERLLAEIIWGCPMAYAHSSVWAATNSTYIINGKKKKLNYASWLKDHSIEELRDELAKYEEANQPFADQYYNSKAVQDFVESNRERLNEITSEAVSYIQKITEGRQLNEIFVSFSGGKDSTVSSDLVMRAIGTSGVIHLYGDTTLEYPESEVYVKRFRQNHPSTPFLTAKNSEQDFLSMARVIGPPSRIMRWCCTVFKTGAITKKIESTFKNRQEIISFQGIRRNESKSRSKYERETSSPKIAKQKAVSPIIDWFDSDIWLYILANQIDINDAYKKGFTRVGCWCCPNNSAWSEFLSSIYMFDQSRQFKEFLYDFAKQIGKPDWKEYVDDGYWKARQGGNGVEAADNTVVSFEPCVLEENTLNFYLNRDIEPPLYELFRPFGKLDFTLGRKRLNEVYVLDRMTNNPILRLSGKIGTRTLKVAVVGHHPAFKSTTITESLIKAQVTKYQSCIGCMGCVGTCRQDAIKVHNLDKEQPSRDSITYMIDENKCIGCLNCVLHFDRGCLMYKVLKVQKNVKDRKDSSS